MAGYGTDEGLTDWLTANGYSLPEGAATTAVLRQRGSAYVDGTYGPRFVGVPTSIDQNREWPRTGATIFGSTLASDVIPNRVIEASYWAAYLIATNPGAFSKTVDTDQRVKRQKVDTIEREFFEPGKMAVGFVTASVNSDIEGLLAPLISPVGGFPTVLVV